MGTATQTLAGFASGLRLEDLPDAVRDAVKRHCVDVVGVALANAARGGCAPVVDMVRSHAGARESTVLGHDLGAPAAWAALANGALAHADEYDDTHPESTLSMSAVVVPAALAVAEEAGTDGAGLIAAITAGYEVAARIGAAAPGRFQARGYDPTGVCGPFGAAAAAARAWELGAPETAAALGLAGAFAGGSLASLADGSETFGIQAGIAAFAGVTAADMARRGMAGPSTVFEGPHGLFDTYLRGEEPDRDRLAGDLGSVWETLRIALKPYPACHLLHASMDAAARCTVKWADIERIECAIPPAAVPLIAEPRAPRLQPATAHAARYSLPFAVASAVVGGRDPSDLFGEDARHDRRVLTLAERVHHVVDPTLGFPRVYGGKLVIYTRSGRELLFEEPVNRGHPDRPLSDDEVAEKFLANARHRFDRRVSRRALGRLERLEAVEDVAVLASSLGIG